MVGSVCDSLDPLIRDNRDWNPVTADISCKAVRLFDKSSPNSEFLFSVVSVIPFLVMLLRLVAAWGSVAKARVASGSD